MVEQNSRQSIQDINIDLKINLLLLGEPAVGKTSLLNRFSGGEFKKDQIGTAGVANKEKNIVHADKNIKLQIWDTTGHKRYREDAISFQPNAAGIVVVYDVTDATSYENIPYWLDRIF